MSANNADRLTHAVRHKSYAAEQRAVQYQHNQKPTTCSVYRMTAMQSHSIDLPIATDLHPVCELLHLRLRLFYKSYKAKGSTCVSIFDQWLLWSGSRPAVIVQT